MTVQDDKEAGEGDARKSAEEDVQDDNAAGEDDDREVTPKPEPDEDDKKAAAEMMKAYQDQPTLVLPGSGGMVSGTAVNEWLDDDGNPKFEVPDDEGQKDKAEEAMNDESKKEQIEKDKALNEKLREAAGAENKGEND
jgi:hypothetical protein